MVDLANRMGLLILQDMPSMYNEFDLPGRLHVDITAGEKRHFESEFKTMVEVRDLWIQSVTGLYPLHFHNADAHRPVSIKDC